MDPTPKQAEELKRKRAKTPEERWEEMKAFLNWAEANQKPEERRNRPRWRDAEGRVHFF